MMAVDPIERERRQGCINGADTLFGKRDEVWNAAHEREGLSIQIRDGHICRADYALSPRSRRPMQHRSAGKVSAAGDQCDTLYQFEFFALPELDAAIRLPHPIGIIGVEK